MMKIGDTRHSSLYYGTVAQDDAWGSTCFGFLTRDNHPNKIVWSHTSGELEKNEWTLSRVTRNVTRQGSLENPSFHF